MKRSWSYPIIMTVTAMTVQAAAAAALTSTDARIVASVDPRKGFSGYPTSTFLLQLGMDATGKNIQRDITAFPEPGYLDPRISQYTILRNTDPANPSRKAFRHKIAQGMAYRQDSGYQSARAEVMSRWGYTSATIKKGVPYWATFAIYIDKDHPFNGSGDDLDILELGHPTSSKNTNPGPAFYLRKNGTWDSLVWGNRVLDGDKSTRVGAKPFSEPIRKGVWHYVIVQFKLEWDASKGPYFRVWRATGSGSPVQIANSSAPNTWNETNTYTPWKFGLYQWNVTSWGTSATRTVYTKGLHIFRDQPGSAPLNVTSMLEFVRGI